jgi:thiol-disulfide isomerase/thioredoxin
MNRLDRVTNVAMLLVCVGVLAELASRHAGFSRSAPARQTPPVYAAGEKLAPIAGLTLDTDRPSLLLVVRSGCNYCKQSVPFYQQLVQEVREKQAKVRLVGVCVESNEACAEYFKTTKVAVDRTVGVEPGTLKIAGTPTLLLVDQKGTVSSVWTGALAKDVEQRLLKTVIARPVVSTVIWGGQR